MRTTIDKAGRIVIPKAMRDELGFNGGTEVEVTLVDGRIEIEPSTAHIRLEKKNGHWVAVSDREMPPLTVEMVRDTIEKLRR